MDGEDVFPIGEVDDPKIFFQKSMAQQAVYLDVFIEPKRFFGLFEVMPLLDKKAKRERKMGFKPFTLNFF